MYTHTFRPNLTLEGDSIPAMKTLSNVFLSLPNFHFPPLLTPLSPQSLPCALPVDPSHSLQKCFPSATISAAYQKIQLKNPQAQRISTAISTFEKENRTRGRSELASESVSADPALESAPSARVAQTETANPSIAA